LHNANKAIDEERVFSIEIVDEFSAEISFLVSERPATGFQPVNFSFSIGTLKRIAKLNRKRLITVGIERDQETHQNIAQLFLSVLEMDDV
jgi:hypothetical protein